MIKKPSFIPLVNTKDEIIGSGEKLDVHKKGLLHRAFSIIIYNNKGEMLMQQRAWDKYHSPGLWTNTCCSHPYVAEGMNEAVLRRLNEEMGFHCKVHYQFKFLYKAAFSNGLTEHELDHVYTGLYEGEIQENPDEVAASRWLSKNEVMSDIEKKPDTYTYWFKHLLYNYQDKL